MYDFIVYANAGMTWYRKDPRATQHMLGFIPEFLSVHDPRPAVEQIKENYCAGWNSFGVGQFREIDGGRHLKYPGDPPIPLLWEAKLRDETIRVYDCEFVSITQADGTVDYARLD